IGVEAAVVAGAVGALHSDGGHPHAANAGRADGVGGDDAELGTPLRARFTLDDVSDLSTRSCRPPFKLVRWRASSRPCVGSIKAHRTLPPAARAQHHDVAAESPRKGTGGPGLASPFGDLARDNYEQFAKLLPFLSNESHP